MNESAPAPRIIEYPIEDEMKEAFIDYSMSVIVSRALPDVRDGLKPVHRRILFAMQELGLVPNRAYKKSATVVGDVLGKYHPHGDSAVYDSMVRMAQDFSLRYPLVDGQGNFGSIDGDSAAAYRYTEARLTHTALDVLKDIDRDTVDFVPNFDNRLREPSVLPSRVPLLLVNGTTGIAVGMATSIPPHNLREVVQATILLARDPDAGLDAIMAHIKGPDFPTGGVIYGLDGIRDAYETGRGRAVVRGRARVEEREDGGERIVIDDIPYMVNKAKMVEEIADLVRDKKVEGVSDLRDESDREGMRVVVELKRDAIPQIVLNQIYRHSKLQDTFPIILLALVKGRPRIMGIKEILLHFLDHRREVIIRRTEFDLRKAEARIHVLHGLRIAVEHIDEVIKIIRGAATTEAAELEIRSKFGFTEIQAKAILDMRLAKLTGLERDALLSEIADVEADIERWKEFLASPVQILDAIVAELEAVAERYGDERRTGILNMEGSLSIEDLLPDEEFVITLTHGNYIKRVGMDAYRSQRRGGRGVNGMETKDSDFVEHLFTARTHDTLLFFTRCGRGYQMKVHELPQGSRMSRGKPLVNVLEVGSDEKIAALVPLREITDLEHLVFVTRKGTIKRTAVSDYSKLRRNGVIAMALHDGDRLEAVLRLNSDGDEILLGTRNGRSIRFPSSELKVTGRNTLGVRGMALSSDDEIVGAVRCSPETTILTVTELGLGKRSAVDHFRLQHRGGQGVTAIKRSDKTGHLVALRAVEDDEQLILVTRDGVINKQSIHEIPVLGRSTQGVRLITLAKKDVVTDIAIVRVDDDETGEDDDILESVGGEPSTPAYSDD